MSGQLQTRGEINEIATLLIPVSGKLLVLPNVSVAEIANYREPDPEDDVPNWYLGRLQWRTVDVPVVSFEAINDEPFHSNTEDRRIVILNSVSGNSELSFFGLVTQGAPRLMRVLSDEIATDPEFQNGPAEIARVLVNGERGAIPDVEFIEHELLKML